MNELIQARLSAIKEQLSVESKYPDIALKHLYTDDVAMNKMVAQVREDQDYPIVDAMKAVVQIIEHEAAQRFFGRMGK